MNINIPKEQQKRFWIITGILIITIPGILWIEFALPLLLIFPIAYLSIKFGEYLDSLFNTDIWWWVLFPSGLLAWLFLLAIPVISLLSPVDEQYPINIDWLIPLGEAIREFFFTW